MTKVNFDEVINRYSTYCTQWDYVKDRFGVEGLLPFTISDMDFKAPKEVIDACIKRCEHGIFGYSRWNHDDYKNSIVNWYKKRFSYNIDANWIIYVPTVIYAIAKIIENYTSEDSNILLITPAYDSFFNIIKNNKRKTLLTSMIEDKNGSYSLDWNDFENKCAQSSALILCNPNNPNGHLWSEDELSKIVSICKKYNVLVISDDIHMDIVYKPYKFVPILQVAEKFDYVSNTFIITSASKTFNTASLGGAYALIPNCDVFSKLQLIMKEKEALSSPMILGMISTMIAYNECDYWLDELLDYCYNNMIKVKQFLDKQVPEISFILPRATYFAWIDCQGLGLSDNQLQERLVSIGNVAIMSGSTYGQNGVFLRFNVGAPYSKIEEGLLRLKKSLKT